MEFNADFVKGVFSNADISEEEKITQIVDGYHTSVNGLVSKKEELLKKVTDHKAESELWTKKESEYNQKLLNLEETLKKASTDKESTAEYWKTQFEGKIKEKDDLLGQREKDYSELQGKYYNFLKQDAIRTATKDLRFMDGLEEGFIYTILAKNNFEPKNINGEIKFLNAENEDISSAVHKFIQTPQGKAYLKAPASGSGERGNSTNYATSGATLTRSQYNEMAKNPTKLSEFKKKNPDWKIVD